MIRNKKIIVSSADSKYFNLLNELFYSIKDNDLMKEFDFGVLDTGLSYDQVGILKDLGALVKKAEWNVEFPNYKIRGRDYLKNIIARAFLPEYFEGYHSYIWVDADTWINHKNTFLLFDKGCSQNRLCITPQVDRSYGKLAKVEWFFNFPKKIKTINYKNFSRSISYNLARKYALFPTLNGGAFSINDNINIWKIFQKNIKLASKKGRIFGTDQVALALCVYEDNVPVEFLPAYTNWMCESHKPLFDNNDNLFVEPYLPHHPIGLMHLAGMDDIRGDENINLDIKDVNGTDLKKSIRYKHNRH